MNTQTTKAEVCWIAFKALSKKEREVFLGKLLSQKRLREELLDLTLVEQRKEEPAISLDTYIKRRKNRNRLRSSPQA